MIDDYESIDYEAHRRETELKVTKDGYECTYTGKKWDRFGFEVKNE